jgi:hypothetical protein
MNGIHSIQQIGQAVTDYKVLGVEEMKQEERKG